MVMIMIEGGGDDDDDDDDKRVYFEPGQGNPELPVESQSSTRTWEFDWQHICFLTESVL